jgi:hypothetical protein
MRLSPVFRSRLSSSAYDPSSSGTLPSRLPAPPRHSATYQNNPPHHSSGSQPAVEETLLLNCGDDSVFLPNSPPPLPATERGDVPATSLADLAGGHGLFSRLKVPVLTILPLALCLVLEMHRISGRIPDLTCRIIRPDIGY